MGELYQVLLDDPGALGLLARRFFDDTAPQSFAWPDASWPFTLPAEIEKALPGARALRTRLLSRAAVPKSLLITSPGAKDGKTSVALSLAYAAARLEGVRCLLIDANLRQPHIATSLGWPESPGLTDLLEGAAPLRDVVRRAEFPEGLCIMTAGTPRTACDELLHTVRWRQLCLEARAHFDLIVIDGPAWTASDSDQALRAAADGVLLAARIDHTRRDQLAAALEALAGPSFLGVVLAGI